MCTVQVSELTKQITEKQDQLDKMKQENIKEKKEQKRLMSEIEAIQDMNKDIEKYWNTLYMYRDTYMYY